MSASASTSHAGLDLAPRVVQGERPQLHPHQPAGLVHERERHAVAVADGPPLVAHELAVLEQPVAPGAEGDRPRDRAPLRVGTSRDAGVGWDRAGA
jgi:hypothetical protein